MTGEKRDAASRRTVLRAAGAVGGLTGFAGAQAGITGSGRAQATEIELDGAVSGWVGRSPESIAGGTNPTLDLEAGQTYRVTWTNADGVPHSFVIEDADGTRLAGTEIVEGEDASRTLEFEAAPAMAEYYCEVHPQSMRGSVAVASGTTAEGATGETTAGEATGTTAEEEPTESTTAEGPPPVIEAETIVLGARVAYWLGLAPSGI